MSIWPTRERGTAIVGAACCRVLPIPGLWIGFPTEQAFQPSKPITHANCLHHIFVIVEVVAHPNQNGVIDAVFYPLPDQYKLDTCGDSIHFRQLWFRQFADSGGLEGVIGLGGTQNTYVHIRRPEMYAVSAYAIVAALHTHLLLWFYVHLLPGR